MKKIDKLLQNWRIDQALKYIPSGSSLLDIGCSDGAIFKRAKHLISDGIGVDPLLKENKRMGSYILMNGYFPETPKFDQKFDVITMLAVLEHIPEQHMIKLSEYCFRILQPDGRLIITVPSPIVDQILMILKFFKIIDAMALEEHHGFAIKTVNTIFNGSHFKLIKRKKFELGLNNIFVFKSIK